jgi:hypothetical protein
MHSRRRAMRYLSGSTPAVDHSQLSGPLACVWCRKPCLMIESAWLSDNAGSRWRVADFPVLDVRRHWNTADQTRLNLAKAFRFGLRVCGSLGIGVMLKSRSKKEIPATAPSLGRTDASF